MKKVLWIVIAAAVVGLGAFLYFRYSAPPAEPVTPGLPEKITEPVPASSYGKGELGNEANSEIQPAEITVNEVGVLLGTAKPAPGANPNFAAIKVSISDPVTGNELASVNLDAANSYKFTVAPGEYVLNASGAKSDQLPQRIYVGVKEVINVNFFVK